MVKKERKLSPLGAHAHLYKRVREQGERGMTKENFLCSLPLTCAHMRAQESKKTRRERVGWKETSYVLSPLRTKDIEVDKGRERGGQKNFLLSSPLMHAREQGRGEEERKKKEMEKKRRRGGRRGKRRGRRRSRNSSREGGGKRRR